MASARGYAAIGVWHPKTAANIGTLWRSAYLYDTAMIFTVGSRYRKQASDTVHATRHIPLVHHVGLGDLIDHLPYGCLLVGVELDPRARCLTSYGHPERAAYLLGAEDHGLPEHVLGRCHSVVQIPTARAESMNVAVAGSILLHDRYTKGIERRSTYLEGVGVA